jgi:hypothetical protein
VLLNLILNFNKLTKLVSVILCLLDRASLWQLKNKRPTSCHLLFYFTSYVLNIFWTLRYPTSGACDYSIELPLWSSCSWFDLCWRFRVVGLEWYSCCRLKLASAYNADTTQTQPHQISNTHRTKNKTTNVVTQQTSCKLPMMDTLTPKTCWTHKKLIKIANDIKLVFYSSTSQGNVWVVGSGTALKARRPLVR